MELYPDSRFYNIPVNLNYSIVHVPTNIYYEGTSTLWITEFFGLCPSSSILKNTFQKLDLFLSSGERVGGTYCVGLVRRR
jgi:hypothetical protein